MCRNIKRLFNFDPQATQTEIDDAARQFVRKLSGFTAPSKINEAAFEQAVRDISDTVAVLLTTLETKATPKNREQEKAKAQRKYQLQENRARVRER